MHILSLQPYFGGSHRAFQQGWQRYSDHRWTVLTLPPRHWKWRMRHAAVHFAAQLHRDYHGVQFDAVVCSDFLNLAEFRGLAPESIRRLPAIAYFHENQFAYPTRQQDPRDLHFGFTNFTTCLAADSVWFNSKFNRDTFFQQLKNACHKWPDFSPMDQVVSLSDKCLIQPPGIEVNELPSNKEPGSVPKARVDPIRLVWAARWEHDKNPELLLAALQQLQNSGVEFQIDVIGESFRSVPDSFEKIRQQFAGKIGRWGFQDLQQYCQAMQQADFFISTASHEFFGIAAAEAIVSGVVPILPDRLAYPELLNVGQIPERRDLFLYDGTPSGLVDRVVETIEAWGDKQRHNELARLAMELANRLAWPVRAHRMDTDLNEIREKS